MDAEQEVISNLKFISMIKKNEKINTQFMYIQKNGIFTRFSRTFINPDNRYNTLTFLQRTINNTFQILDRYTKYKKENDSQYKNIVKDLLKARIGLVNIQETYTDDLKFKCDITTLIETIENKVPGPSFVDDETEEDIVLENEILKDEKSGESDEESDEL